jgi:phospholipid transport system transporter-binding protein
VHEAAEPRDVIAPLILADEITIESVAQVRTILLARLEEDGACHLHAGNVRRIDGAGVQLLFAFVRDAAARGTTVHWLEPSPALVATARALGLHAALSLP